MLYGRRFDCVYIRNSGSADAQKRAFLFHFGQLHQSGYACAHKAFALRRGCRLTCVCISEATLCLPYRLCGGSAAGGSRLVYILHCAYPKGKIGG